MLEARQAEIEPWIVGYHPDETDFVAVALFEMFGSFRSMAGQGDVKLAATVEGLRVLLRPYPRWAIERACSQIRELGVWRDGGYDKQWAPSDAEIIAAVREKTRLYRDQYDSAVALLNAKVAT